MRQLLAEARAAGLCVRREGAQLVVRGPQTTGRLARALLTRKSQVLGRLCVEDPLVARAMRVFDADLIGPDGEVLVPLEAVLDPDGGPESRAEP